MSGRGKIKLLLGKQERKDGLIKSWAYPVFLYSSLYSGSGLYLVNSGGQVRLGFWSKYTQIFARQVFPSLMR